MYSYATRMLITQLDRIIHTKHQRALHPAPHLAHAKHQRCARMVLYRAGARLFTLATHYFQQPYVSLSRLVQRIADVFEPLLRYCASGHPLQIATQIAPWVIVRAQHAVVIRDCVILALLAALRTFPLLLAIHLHSYRGMFQLVVQADTCALGHQKHPYFQAALHACTQANLACWSQPQPPAWNLVGPAINLAKRRQFYA